MFFSEQEKFIMEPLFDMINDNSDKKFKIILQDDTEVIATPDCDYETDNGLDVDEEGYEEFNAILFKVDKIINKQNSSYIYNGFLEITYHNFPKHIEVIN